jgi:hypothetical protein
MSVEAEYRALIDATSVIGRVRRADALFRWSRDYLARTIAAASPSLSERELKLQVALRVYGADPEMRALIRELQRRAAR